MFRTFNRKFQALAVAIAVLFCLGYAILALFLQEQSETASAVHAATTVEREVRALQNLFYRIRLWDRNVLAGMDPDAERRFGALMAELEHKIAALQGRPLSVRLNWKLHHTGTVLGRYEEMFNRIVQLRTEQRLAATRIESVYRSLVSVILRSDNARLLKPLFNLTHFQTAYFRNHSESEFDAIRLVLSSLRSRQRAANLSDPRLFDYLDTYQELLEEEFVRETRHRELNHLFSLISSALFDRFTILSADATGTLGRHIREAEERRRTLSMWFTLSTVFSVVILMVILRVVAKKIVSPIRALTRTMQRVRDGNSTARFAFAGNEKDELIQVGHEFNTMLDTVDRHKEELEEKVRQLAERGGELGALNRSLEEEIGERKKAEGERRTLETQLRHAQKMEAIGTLAGGVAHDLNNVLSGIVGYPELLLLEMPEESPMRKNVEAIRRSGERAAAIVQDLLTLARRGVPVKVAACLNTVVTGYLESPEFEALQTAHPGLAVTTGLAEALLPTKGSPIHLSKTFMNLVVNAAEAMPGGGTVAVATESVYLDRPVRGYDTVAEGEYVVLSVADTGVGISSEHLERIFEPFFTRKTMGRSGTGLGMAVVWGTVKDHDGYIDVDSEEGRGTTFTLYFPATREKVAAAASDESKAFLEGAGERILVIDDIAEQRDIATGILQKLGYSVATAPGGEAALAYLAKERADLLVLDMIMDPGMDGLETYRSIVSRFGPQRAIIVSGFSESRRVHETQKLGAGAYVRKPYRLESIGRAVRDELARPLPSRD